MQTMMIQSPPAPATPASGKTSAVKGSGSFENLLAGNSRDTAQKIRDDQDGSDNELLAAAAMTPWPSGSPSDSSAQAQLLEASSPGPLAAELGPQPTVPAPAQGLEPGPNPQPQPASLPAQLQSQLQAQALVQGQGLTPATGAKNEPALASEALGNPPLPTPLVAEPPQAPQPGAKASPVSQPANPALAAGAALAPPAEAVVHISAAPSAALPTPYPGAELPRGQKGSGPTAAPVEQGLAVELDGEEPLVEGSSKAAGLSEARFSEMLQGAGQPRQPSVATKAGALRMEPFDATKEASAGAKAAASALQFTPESATSEPAEAVLPSTSAGNHAAAVATTPAAPAAANPSAAPSALTLPSGQLVPESEVLSQVLGRLRVGASRDSSSLSMKLNPEELGEVRLELVVEKDRVRAMILAQNQQVQEVLERHLPRLREALQQQGLKLEEVQVGVDSRQQESQRGFSQEQRPGANPSRFGAGRDGFGVSPELPAMVQATAGPVASGLSIRI